MTTAFLSREFWNVGVPARLVGWLFAIACMAAARLRAVALTVIRMRLIDRAFDSTENKVIYVSRLLTALAYEGTCQLSR